MTSSQHTSRTEDKPLKACEENADTSYMNTTHKLKLPAIGSVVTIHPTNGGKAWKAELLAFQPHGGIIVRSLSFERTLQQKVDPNVGLVEFEA
jgi:hypothetical protein